MSVTVEIRRMSGEIGGYHLTESAYEWFENVCDVDTKEAISVAVYNGIYDENELEEFRTTLFDSDYSEEYYDAIQEFIESIHADGETMEAFYESPLYIGAVSYNDRSNFPLILDDDEGNTKDLEIDLNDYNFKDMNWCENDGDIDDWWEEHEDEVKVYMKEHDIDDEDEAAKLMGVPEFAENPEFSIRVLVFESISKGSWSGTLPNSVKTLDDVDPSKFSCLVVTPYTDFGDYVSMDGIKYDGNEIEFDENSTGYETNLTAIEG